MARSKSVYRCTDCGHEHPKWVGRCEACGAWNSVAEEPVVVRAATPAARRGARAALVTPPVQLREVATRTL